jgi:hypothetical protein
MEKIGKRKKAPAKPKKAKSRKTTRVRGAQ